MQKYIKLQKSKSSKYPFFRMVIPIDLRSKFGGSREFYISLKDVSNSELELLLLDSNRLHIKSSMR